MSGGARTGCVYVKGGSSFKEFSLVFFACGGFGADFTSNFLLATLCVSGLGGREIVLLPPMNTGDRGSGGTAPVAPSPHPRGLLRKGRRRDCTSGSPPPHTDGDTHIMASSMHKTTGPRGGRLCGCAAAAGLRRSLSGRTHLTK